MLATMFTLPYTYLVSLDDILPCRTLFFFYSLH